MKVAWHLSMCLLPGCLKKPCKIPKIHDFVKVMLSSPCIYIWWMLYILILTLIQEPWTWKSPPCTSLLQMEILLWKDKLESVFRMIDFFKYKHGDLLSKRCHDCAGCWYYFWQVLWDPNQVKDGVTWPPFIYLPLWFLEVMNFRSSA